MRDVKGLYSIRQVAEMTGLSTQLIRKWEERYQLVQPKRLENGYRVYSDQDVTRLRSVQVLVEEGYSVKNAVLSLTEKRAETPVMPILSVELDHLHEERQEQIARLLNAGSACNEHQLTYILQRASHEFTFSSFLHGIVVPFLQKIGDRWQLGEWSEYQEHISSQVVRDFLVQMRRSMRENEDGPLLLGTCLPNELHEIPVHIILLQAAQLGWRTLFLHASPAEGAIEQAVLQLQPDRVVLSALTINPFTSNPKLLDSLDCFAQEHPDISFYLGGPGAFQYTNVHGFKAIHVTSRLEEVLRM